MGVRATIAGVTVRPDSYRVSESSMPLAGGDSSGAVGTIEMGIPRVPFLPLGLNLEEPLDLIDTNRGSTLGTVRQVGDNRTGAVQYDITANTRLGEFNIETQVLPFTGTLGGAFEYYCSLANIDSGIVVDPAIAGRQVNFIGWNGNLWTHMKEMATGINADLNLISNNVVLRPVRLFEAIQDREVESSADADGTQLALKQEVIWYDTEYVSSGLIYPPGGWTTEVRVLSVNAGETTESTLDTNSSMFSIQQPVPSSSQIPPGHDSSSVYTVVGDDGIQIPAAQWLDYGGRLSVEVSEDTRSLVVTITGATGLVQTNGDPMKTFRIGLGSGTSSSDTYSTLRIVGSAIMRNEQSVIIPTGVEEWRTGQEFAPTIDNTFLNTLDDAYSAGVRGARRYAGRTMSISANVTALNKRGNTGTANYPPYSYVQGVWGSDTYGSVGAINAGKTYADVQAEFYALVQDNFDNQIFGNAPGARFWDRRTGRWYRIRDAVTEWSQISVEGDDDLLNGDMQAKFQGQTYAQVGAHYGGASYYKANLRGAV